jgi:hypothetical protein
MRDDVGDNRALALDLAVNLYNGRRFEVGKVPSQQVIAAAEKFFEFLYRPAAIVRIGLRAGKISKQGSIDPLPHNKKDGTMQLHDDEQVDYTVAATDAKGQPVTGEQIQFSVDNPDVLGLQVSADGATATIVAGTEGSGVLTATVGSLTATEAIDVIAGDATAVTLVAGEVTKQTSA